MSLEKNIERIADALEAHLALAKGGKPASPAPAAAATATKNPAAAGKAADKAAAAGKPGGKPATSGKPPQQPAVPTKAPGGKYNSTQVREKLREVAANPALGKQAARDIISDDGGGATNFAEVKPELFDAIYEACQVALSGEGHGEKATPAEDDDEFA